MRLPKIDTVIRNLSQAVEDYNKNFKQEIGVSYKVYQQVVDYLNRITNTNCRVDFSIVTTTIPYLKLSFDNWLVINFTEDSIEYSIVDIDGIVTPILNHFTK